jgi:hypothetical protein
MAIQFSVAVRNARLNAIEAEINTTAKLLLYTGSQPANCATAASGSLLATLTLPSDWMAAAASGVKGLSGSWTGAGSGAGTAGYFRITANDGTTVGMQGSVGVGSGDLQVDNAVIAVSQTINVTAFNITDANS